MNIFRADLTAARTTEGQVDITERRLGKQA